MAESVSQMVQRLEQGAERLLEQYNAVVSERDTLLSIMQQMTATRQSSAPDQILETLKKVQAAQQPEPFATVAYGLRVRKTKKKTRKKKAAARKVTRQKRKAT